MCCIALRYQSEITLPQQLKNEIQKEKKNKYALNFCRVSLLSHYILS